MTLHILREFRVRTVLTKSEAGAETFRCSSEKRVKGRVRKCCCLQLPRAWFCTPTAEELAQARKVKDTTWLYVL